MELHALLCEWLSEYVCKSVCASVSFWQKIMKPYWTSCFFVCNHNLFFLNLISSSLSHFKQVFPTFSCFFPPLFLFSLFYILPHGPIKSPVFRIYYIFWEGWGYKDMYSCILMAQVKLFR